MRKLIILIAILPIFAYGQTYKKYTQRKDGIDIQLSEGVLNLTPITAKAIRVQWQKELPKEQLEFVLVNKQPVPTFKVSETAAKLKLSTSFITVTYDKQKGTLDYSDAAGKIFLSEQANSRKLKPSTVMGQQCYIAEQGFKSPADEYLFGLGQFQDGQYNLRN